MNAEAYDAPDGLGAVGAFHILGLIFVAFVALFSISRDVLSFQAYFLGSPVWLLVLMGSLDLLKGRRAGIRILLVFHSCLFLALVFLLWHAIEEYRLPLPMPAFATDDTPSLIEFGRYIMLLFSSGSLVASGMVLVGMLSLDRRYFGKRGRSIPTAGTSDT